MIKAGHYTIWLTFGRYDIVLIDRVIRERATAVQSNDSVITVRLCDCYGVFKERAKAEHAIEMVRKIHALHAGGIKHYEKRLNDARKMRNKNILDFLKGLK